MITNTLSPDLDWSTFQLTELRFGDNFIEVPYGSTSLETTLSMTYEGVTFDVQISAGITMATGQVYARFYSIDQETELPPAVEIGFLPPEDGNGRGQGHVGYIIKPRQTVAENTVIKNIALIVFDMGEEIYTNQVDPHNPGSGTDPEKEAPVTIDKFRPVSHIDHLEKLHESLFSIFWSGSDSGAGISQYSIYVRDTQQLNWELLTQSNQIGSINFTAEPGHTYEFYCTSIDGVGNLEHKPPIAETTLKVDLMIDTDHDSIADIHDNCPEDANSDQADNDHDMLGDVCDDDDDNDTVKDNIDNCPFTINTDQQDTDSDGLGDVCDPDDDNDNTLDGEDNCPFAANPAQLDSDQDGRGDICDACPLDKDNDIDQDGLCGNLDNCPEISNSEQADLDQDGIGDKCDAQTCGNGRLEPGEQCDDGNYQDDDGCSSACLTKAAKEMSILLQIVPLLAPRDDSRQ